MFGEKVRAIVLLKEKVERVQTECDAYKTELDTAGPWLSLAKELQQRVAGKLSSSGDEDMDAAFALSVNETEDELLKKTIELKLDSLPTEKILDMYASVLGDDSVLDPLKRIAEIRRRETERKAVLMEIQHDATVSRRLDMTRLPEGEIIKIGLFSNLIAEFKKTDKYSNYAGRTITARVHEQPAAILEVLSDTVHAEKSLRSRNEGDNDRLKDHELITVGSTIWQGGIPKFEPVVTHNTEITLLQPSEMDPNNARLIVGLDLGYVTMGDLVVLDIPG